jgi:4-hydroxybenzoate polyprenyltransferase
MKILKFIILLFAIGLGAYVFLYILGIIASLFWYGFWIGLIAIGGTVGYKLFLKGNKDEKPKLEEKKPTAISELENVDRALEEYKQKYLSK